MKKYLHTLLFTLYPIFFFFNANKNEVFLTSLFAPLVMSLIFASIVFITIYFFNKKRQNVAFLTSTFLLLFFSYGHILNTLNKSFGSINGSDIPYKNFLWILWLIIFGIIAFIFRKKSTKNIDNGLNFISIFLFLFLIFDIFKNPKLIKFSDNLNVKPSKTTEQKVSKNYRDIYFIIPDRYGSNETFIKHYDFDNEDFIKYLTDKGFFIADKSQSTYPTTTMSVGSQLNMKFLDEFTALYGTNTSNFKPVVSMLRNNQVGQILKDRSYKFINFSSWWHVTQKFDIEDYNFSTRGLVNDEFTVRFLETTLFSAVSNYLLPEEFKLNLRNQQKNIANYQSDIIKDIVKIQGPKFVLVHIMLPHPPYVFDKDCNFLKEKFIDNRTETVNYVDQLQCANKKLKKMVNDILNESKIKPIIVLQSDEGPHPIKSPLPKDNDWKNADQVALSEKFKILNAVYFPDIDQSIIPQDLSPINTFRFIFNNYFGDNYEYLPKKTFIFQDQGHIFDYKEITNKIKFDK